MKIQGSEGVSMEEFLDDISKLKRKYSYELSWKLRTYLLSKGDWFTKSQRVEGCHEGWDRLLARNKVWKFVDFPPWHKFTKNKRFIKIKYWADGLINKVQGPFSGVKLYLNWGYILHRDIFSYRESYLYSPNHSPGYPFGPRVVSNGRKTAFLNDDLEEEIYVDQSIGFVSKG